MENTVPFDRQAVYNRVRDHLLEQGRKSLLHKEGVACAYRGHDGTKCAVGVLIKDEYYEPLFNSAACSEYSVVVALAASLGCSHDDVRENTEFLRNLQLIHDGSPVEHWKSELEAFAVARGLVP